MYKYLRFAVLGAFLAPLGLFWIVLLIIAVFAVISICSPELVHLGGYTEPEQYYQVVVGYVVKNHKSIPKQMFYVENGKRKAIPPKNVTIRKRTNSDVYDVYVRIRRKDGDGYDYIAAVLKKISDTEYKTIRTSCGREIM